ELAKRLKTLLQEPDVTVSVLAFRTQSVSVLGAVTTPGVKSLDGTKTLVDVLSMAGGPDADAGPIVRVTRRLEEGRIPLAGAVEHKDNGFSIADIPLQPLMDSAAPETNIVIHPNDIASVPRAEV